jgi:phosphatidylserine decarboxylase
MRRSGWATKLEEIRQASRIHGGLFSMFTAALGIRLARLPIPRGLRLKLYRSVFGKKYPPGLDESEAEKPLDEYPSLNAVFTRGIKPHARPIAAGPYFVAPCDGTVQEIGRVDRGRFFTLKGIEYTLASLLPGVDVGPFEHGHFAIIFLSPLDCHRVFSPQEALLEEAIHVPGFRLLVHPPFQRAEYPTYTLNERVIFRLGTTVGPCVLVMIAGWGVGHVTLPAAPAFGRRPHGVSRHAFTPPLSLKRGDWLGTFELGSTVVLLTPLSEADALVGSNDKVKYGEPVFRYPE